MSGAPDFVEEYYEAMKAAATLGSNETRLEEARKIMFSELFNAAKGSVDAREHEARADIGYVQATDTLNNAREAAALARAKVMYLAAKIDVWRTRMASARELRRQGDAFQKTNDESR